MSINSYLRAGSRSTLNTKTRYDLVPFGALAQIADVLAYGADKYEANNWARGTAWWCGEDLDSETGLSHLAHAGCCLLFLLEYQRNGWGSDDRFRGPDSQPFTKHDGRVAIKLQQDLDLN